MKDKIDPEIIKANKEVKIACTFFAESEDALKAIAKTYPQEFVKGLAFYIARHGDPLPDPTEEAEKLAKQCMDVYRLLARLVATIEVRERSIVFFSTRPRLEIKTCARVAHAFGKAQAFLGVCWEDTQLPEAVGAHLADHFIRCLRSALENVRIGYQELIKVGLEENP